MTQPVARNPISDHPAIPPAETPDDGTLAQAIARAIDAEGRLDGTAIGVAVSEGVVRLTGQVPLEFQRQLADAVVGAVPGVLVIENHLDVAET